MTTPHSADLDRLGEALRQDLDALAAQPTMPSATAVWLRAERQARLDALKQVERPIWLAERMALVGAGVAIGWMGTLVRDWLGTHDLSVATMFLPDGAARPIGGIPVMVVGAALVAGLGIAAGLLAARSTD